MGGDADTESASPVPDGWTGSGPRRMRRTFKALGPDNSLFSRLTSTDQRGAEARRARLGEASPSIPSSVLTFLVVVIAAVVLYHALTSPPRSGLHIAATAIAAGTMLAAVAVFLTLDRPFSGPIRIEPTQLQVTAGDITEDFVDAYGTARLRCDRNGNPTRTS